MDEFNLASRFAKEEDEEPSRGRGKLKRLRPGRTGVGMEKPASHGKVVGEGSVGVEKTEIAADDMNVRPGVDEESEIDSPRRTGTQIPEADMEEDDAFLDLVDRMEGESASAGRASARRAKLKGRRPMPRKEDEDEE